MQKYRHAGRILETRIKGARRPSQGGSSREGRVRLQRARRHLGKHTTAPPSGLTGSWGG